MVGRSFGEGKECVMIVYNLGFINIDYVYMMEDFLCSG